MGNRSNLTWQQPIFSHLIHFFWRLASLVILCYNKFLHYFPLLLLFNHILLPPHSLHLRQRKTNQSFYFNSDFGFELSINLCVMQTNTNSSMPLATNTNKHVHTYTYIRMCIHSTTHSPFPSISIVNDLPWQIYDEWIVAWMNQWRTTRMVCAGKGVGKLCMSFIRYCKHAWYPYCCIPAFTFFTYIFSFPLLQFPALSFERCSHFPILLSLPTTIFYALFTVKNSVAAINIRSICLACHIQHSLTHKCNFFLCLFWMLCQPRPLNSIQLFIHLSLFTV